MNAVAACLLSGLSSATTWVEWSWSPCDASSTPAPDLPLPTCHCHTGKKNFSVGQWVFLGFRDAETQMRLVSAFDINFAILRCQLSE